MNYLQNPPPGLLAESQAILQAMRKAVLVAVDEHKRMGNPVAVSRDGRVVWLGPEGEVPPPQDVNVGPQ